MFKKSKVIGLVCAAIFACSTAAEAANVHTVKEGETLWSIGVEHGVSVIELKEANEKESSILYTGEQLNIPASISPEDEDLLSRIVSAEAKGEPYSGKVAVATVVLNRVAHPEFPDSIPGVIYEVSPTGNPAFSPVMNGTINQPADEESKQAVKEALAFEGQGHGSIFFYNPEKATNHWIATRETTNIIGDHTFAK
ncbi:cell wall hydrolase [Alteribacillus iranensis]|uniref:N-acetylmuramoyl-L-alanine amidase n=1 Tax=Alteribacillus iranensis TaxID=930128 RepID=A0A1I2DF44_9BACI|nr:cell wall hydrolase [Alteribacillus iranensis]SFE79114.1 N-acetylmuramoyl-L-alanine amidase [Alteribacillus iranensis]